MTTIVWIHAAAVAAHAAAHLGAAVPLSTPAAIYVLLVIVAGPLLGWWIYKSGRPRAGSAIVACSMAGALIFGLWNHFLAAGADHINMIEAGPWQAPFRLTAMAIAVAEAAGTIAGVAAMVNLSKNVPSL
ncbi:MAG TPA: hypothetical protein VGJ09_10900 [Bryobacteraceae bacterium]